ncbi:zinc-finger protein [Candidatus Omnitrophus magneticus]|uniref:Zinc-finger protein n=1 Tax=Candidatus Omnitrophus magneticus TaxID=1609969 RepID=A0A0F0CQ94_9BACT|nr:zinc-finger protein [Candidatus Omnitrophus magneticus]
MIITRQKQLNEILDYIKDAKKIFLIGCKQCATTCKTGGEDELEKAEKDLCSNGKEIIGKIIFDPACSILEIKRFARNNEKLLALTDAVISFTCGGGTQAVSDVLGMIKVYPGNDTLFQGEITSITTKERRFEQKCSLCGNCLLAVTGAICPVTRCPKELVNGPCGGHKNGKCEIDKTLECAWLKIYEKLKKNNELDKMKKIKPPKDYSKNLKPRREIIF